MAYAAPVVCQNEILASLPGQVLDLLSPHLVHTRMVTGQTLVESGSIPDAIYFLETGVAAVVAADTQGVERLEIALIGAEGFVTPTSLLGAGAAAYNSVVMRSPGRAYRLPLRPFRWFMNENEPFRARMFQSTEVYCAGIQQSLACNIQHPLLQRLTRRLLMTRDAMKETVLEVSHKDLADALGAQRPAVTHALGVLEQQGLVRLERGVVAILDGERLQEAVCGCYQRLGGFSARVGAKRPQYAAT